MMKVLLVLCLIAAVSFEAEGQMARMQQCVRTFESAVNQVSSISAACRVTKEFFDCVEAAANNMNSWDVPAGLREKLAEGRQELRAQCQGHVR